VRSRLSWKWLFDKEFISLSWTSRSGKTKRAGREFLAWDPASERIVHNAYSAEGIYGTGVVTVKDKTRIVEFRGALPNGDELSAKATLKMLDPDRYSWHLTDLKTGDEKLPDMPLVETHRLVVKDKRRSDKDAD
jgi:hypothetical protein